MKIIEHENDMIFMFAAKPQFDPPRGIRKIRYSQRAVLMH
jgi:hypothetical protein